MMMRKENGGEEMGREEGRGRKEDRVAGLRTEGRLL